ncbi:MULTISPECIES: deoxyribonuclease IV [Streptomycetaceae]|uniref:Probable endonuclease 4 n=1 Tax=Streptantibioticus cattleyicolor (strain ATCC 35852 / DSM 46488 / JCM 4925 / NBRC 14057 / NRRL 8057) TaxID=1003195 RepID=F8K0T9_STREN|nr:deoxyribonuclease IV [Streptantibioticus cattleyicolor]AEW93603.1 endonuclease IV [Streptantibioticus cattleyicolor NRRL 8057 = DSM 46488]MYS58307.1 deoxyribonuclease IV [Streptomyces sp. SID5468]CCB73953.1 putative endonuclease 4 [Streptantibioticus cattleyicolor NRRL 8057 = DSM 46488]
MSLTSSPAGLVPRNPVGAHVPVSRGLAAGGLPYARAVGAEVVQVFVANPRGWATTEGVPAQDAAFREGCAAEGVSAYVHAPYLINFGSHTAETVTRSVASLRHSLRRGRAIGARGVVVHTGSATGGRTREVALAQVREHVLPLLDELTHDDDPWLLLEPTAGQGASLCSLMADLGPYFDALDHHPRLGVCLDTCHAFAAGHDLTAPGGTKALLDELVEVCGPGRLKLIHANDSKDVAGAHKDRHENIGAGHIGVEPFRDFFTHPATEGVPLVIETPGAKEQDAVDISRLKALR